MLPITSNRIPMTDVSQSESRSSVSWLWHGYLAAGNVTLLTSQWKTGKTTLLTGLLQQMERGESFVGRPVRAGRALVVSEESRAHWADRLMRMRLGPNVDLLARPFRGRPSVDEWNTLIDEAGQLHEQGELDLLVIDPLASFLPGRCESDAATLLEMLQPLHRLANEGVAVLLLHHPRKKPSEPGCSARGSGALLGFVDIVLELARYGKLKSDHCRRRLIAQSRKPETPDRLAFEWDPASGRFRELADPQTSQFEENWGQLSRILERRRVTATHRELLMDWPADAEPPSASILYEWLNRAFAQKRVLREGNGTKGSPWRYRLKNEDDEYHDRYRLRPLAGDD